MSETNEAERRRWNDERWTSVWPKRERLTDQVTPLLLEAAALRAGEQVLDIGYGGAKTAIAAAGVAGHVVGADISTSLAALATERVRAAGLENVELAVVDMQTDAVPGAPFDVALSQFGVMFFDEPVTAFKNIRAQLRPGGRLAFACWQSLDRNPWFFAPAIQEFLPTPPEPPPGKSRTGPFAFGDPVATTQILESAGFVEVARSAHDLEVDAPTDAVFDEAQLRFMGVADDDVPAALGAAAGYLKQFETAPGQSRFPLAVQIFTAGS